MKKYPKIPYFISPNRMSQLWILIPVCLFLLICKGGFAASIFLLLFWIFYSHKASEKDWRDACDKGYSSLYCNRGYLESQGFKENIFTGIETITTSYNIIEDQSEITVKKKELEKLILEHNFKNHEIYNGNNREIYFRERILYEEIGMYYGCKHATLPNNAYIILKRGGDLYKIKKNGNEIAFDYAYFDSFKEE